MPFLFTSAFQRAVAAAPAPDVDASFTWTTNLLFRFAANKNVWSDLAKTTLAANGAPVAAWGNLGSGAAAQQATLANRPTFRTGGLNGRPYLECVATTGQYFEDIDFTQPTGFTSFRYFTVFAVTDQIAGLTGFPALIGSSITTTGGKVAVYFRDTVDAQIHAFKSAIRFGNVSSPQLLMATVGRSASGATTTPYARFWLRQNKVNIFSAETQTTNPNSSAVATTQFMRCTGLGAAPIGNFNGRLYEFLLYEGTLSDATTFAIENFLVSKYGLPM